MPVSSVEVVTPGHREWGGTLTRVYGLQKRLEQVVCTVYKPSFENLEWSKPDSVGMIWPGFPEQF